MIPREPIDTMSSELYRFSDPLGIMKPFKLWMRLAGNGWRSGIVCVLLLVMLSACTLRRGTPAITASMIILLD